MTTAPNDPSVPALATETGDRACQLLQSNVMGSGLIYRCGAPGTDVVLVPLKAAGGMFFGTGVRALVCAEHAAELVDKYGGRLP